MPSLRHFCFKIAKFCGRLGFPPLKCPPRGVPKGKARCLWSLPGGGLHGQVAGHGPAPLGPRPIGLGRPPASCILFHPLYPPSFGAAFGACLGTRRCWGCRRFSDAYLTTQVQVLCMAICLSRWRESALASRLAGQGLSLWRIVVNIRVQDRKEWIGCDSDAEFQLASKDSGSGPMGVDWL